MENTISKSTKSWGLPRSTETTNSKKGSSVNWNLVTRAYLVVGVIISFSLAATLALFPATFSYLTPIRVSDGQLVGNLGYDEKGGVSNSTGSRSYLSSTSVHAKSKFKNSQSEIVTQRDTSFHFSPRTVDWNKQLQKWRKANPEFRKGRPKVRVVTSSPTIPCPRSIDTHMLLRSAKIKLHYCRMHDIQMQYSLAEPEVNEFNGSWAKLSLIRMLMLAHPEVKWFWWMDSSVVITDMEFNLPLEKYVNHNFVIYADDKRVYRLKDWKGLNAGNFLIRNCQWSLDFLDAWGSMGSSAHTRSQAGKFLSHSLLHRPQGMEADDQSALVYILSTEKGLWGPKTYLEKDVYFTAPWTNVTNKLEVLQKLGQEDPKRKKLWPVATQFSECSRCHDNSSGAWSWEKCELEMDRTMDFAENQMYGRYGYNFQALGVHQSQLDPIPGYKMESVVGLDLKSVKAREFMGVPLYKLPGPQLDDWDAQRRTWFERNPRVSKFREGGLPKTMIVTGSSTKECPQALGEHSLLQSLKNKLDYTRLHDMQVFYGMPDFDRQLDFWWTKIPTVRLLMLSHPDVEWFWWCDGDAAITDMNFELPFDEFDSKGQNLVLYGNSDFIYNKRDWTGINAGVYLARNCQWTLDLFDVWAACGPKDVRDECGRKFTDFFGDKNRPTNFAADDQSALAYILTTDDEKAWSPHVRLEGSIIMSGYWKDLAPRYESMKEAAILSGSTDYPFITHYAGCQPCGSTRGNYPVEECHLQMRRTWNFADDQILALYGLEHSSLEKREVHRTR